MASAPLSKTATPPVEGSGGEGDGEEEKEVEVGGNAVKIDPKAPLARYPLYEKDGSILRWVKSEGLVSLFNVRSLKYTDALKLVLDLRLLRG